MAFDLTVKDELACASLCYRYALYADKFRARVPELFTEFGELELPGRRMVGREAILASFRPRPSVVTLHYCTNVVIEGVGGGRAVGTVHLFSIGFEADEPIEDFPIPMPLGRTGGIYHDEFVRSEAGWLFRKRRLEVIFKGP